MCRFTNVSFSQFLAPRARALGTRLTYGLFSYIPRDFVTLLRFHKPYHVVVYAVRNLESTILRSRPCLMWQEIYLKTPDTLSAFHYLHPSQLSCPLRAQLAILIAGPIIVQYSVT